MKGDIIIVHGGDISEPSGGTNRVIAFANALSQNGFKVNLIVPKPTKEIPTSISLADGIELQTVPVILKRGIKSQIFRGLAVLRKAKKVAIDKNAIIQIEHSSLGGLATLLGISNFVLDMHDLCFANPLYDIPGITRIVKKFMYELERNALSHATRIIVVSNRMKKFVVDEWDIDGKKIIVIPNGYFEGKLKKYLNEKSVRSVDDLNRSCRNTSICFLGTLDPKINIEKIICLANRIKDAQIYVIGEGPVLDKLKRRVRKEGLNNIIITGRIPDDRAFEFVINSQVCILPLYPSKHTEVSCPVKVFDYAALGKAIVADNVAEMCRIFKENDAALVSDPENKEEFIGNVKRLLEDDELRRRLGENARRLVKNFTWEKQGEKLVNMYRRLII